MTDETLGNHSATIPKNDLLRGVSWMLGAILSFSAMAIAGREAGMTLDTFEIMSYRSLVGFVIVCAALAVTGQWRHIRLGQIGLHSMRNLVHFTGQNLWFYAVTVIPLAQLFALEFTAPIWLVLLAPLFLGERLTRQRLIAVVLGFSGILIIAHPSPSTFNIGTFCAFACAVFFALTNICTKKLTRSEGLASILFWLTLMQLFFGLVCAGYDGEIAIPDHTTLPFLLVIGIAGLAAHFSITKALSLAPAAAVIPVDFARLPLIALLGWLIYGETVGLALLIGASFVLVGNTLNIVASQQHSRKLT